MTLSSAILAIDQGTSQSKALLVGPGGAIVASASSPVARTSGRPGYAEVDARHLLQSVAQAIATCRALAPETLIEALAITNQRESVVAWRRSSSEPIGPCILWQCQRTEGFLAEIRRERGEAWIRARTGLPLSTTFSAAKARWLLDHRCSWVPLDDVLVGTVDSWLIWNLTQGKVHASDVSNASRTQLFDIGRRCWDDDLLLRFGVPRTTLPEVLSSDACFGETEGTMGLPRGIPIMAVLGDSHASLFGHGGYHAGRTKATYGTGSSVMRVIENQDWQTSRMAATIAWGIGDQITYAREANILVSGGIIDWMCRFLNVQGPMAPEDILTMAARGRRDMGVQLVPAFFGLGAPFWQTKGVRGLIAGLTWETTLDDVARAAVDAIAYQVGDVLALMEEEEEEKGGLSSPLWVDGGAAASDELMQFQADVCGRTVARAEVSDLSALGVAHLAGMRPGWWPSWADLATVAPKRRIFSPKMSERQRLNLRRAWRRATQQCLT